MAHIRRPTESNRMPAGHETHSWSVQVDALEGIVGPARSCSASVKQNWGSAIPRVRMVLPAGRLGSWRCSEQPADLLSGQHGQCGRRGAHRTTRCRCRAPEWGTSLDAPRSCSALGPGDGQNFGWMPDDLQSGEKQVPQRPPSTSTLQDLCYFVITLASVKPACSQSRKCSSETQCIVLCFHFVNVASPSK